MQELQKKLAEKSPKSLISLFALKIGSVKKPMRLGVVTWLLLHKISRI